MKEIYSMNNTVKIGKYYNAYRIMKMKTVEKLCGILLLCCFLMSCNSKQKTNQQEAENLELRKSIHLSKCYAFHLIANDSIKGGIHILDSLWNTYHLDRMIPCDIGLAYYKAGELDSAMCWFQRAETHIDSLTKIQPSEPLYCDKLPLAYILRGKDAALEVKDKLTSEEWIQQADSFLEYYTEPSAFLEDVTCDMFEAYKRSDYIR